MRTILFATFVFTLIFSIHCSADCKTSITIVDLVDRNGASDATTIVANVHGAPNSLSVMGSDDNWEIVTSDPADLYSIVDVTASRSGDSAKSSFIVAWPCRNGSHFVIFSAKTGEIGEILSEWQSNNYLTVLQREQRTLLIATANALKTSTEFDRKSARFGTHPNNVIGSFIALRYLDGTFGSTSRPGYPSEAFISLYNRHINYLSTGIARRIKPIQDSSGLGSEDSALLSFYTKYWRSIEKLDDYEERAEAVARFVRALDKETNSEEYYAGLRLDRASLVRSGLNYLASATRASKDEIGSPEAGELIAMGNLLSKSNTEIGAAIKGDLAYLETLTNASVQAKEVLTRYRAPQQAASAGVAPISHTRCCSTALLRDLLRMLGGFQAAGLRIWTDLCRVSGGRDGWLVLALVVDCHTRELLGWHLSRSGTRRIVG